MFDAADFVNLPLGVKPAGRCVSAQEKGAGASDGFRAKESDTAAAEASAATLLNRNTCHVVQACAMAGDNVALAMSNGELCHGRLSQTRAVAAAPVPMEERRWPTWSSWPSRSGKVQSLQYDRAHDALVTLEHASTAAGDQAFLGRYHRWRGVERIGKSGATPPSWIGCSVPLATSHAKVAVCASRGWAAVCTGSVVNLWAVAHSRVEPLNARKDSLKSTEMPIGFEHALSVDLAELIGGAGSVTNGGGGSHIALLGNLLAVATEHAVFLVNLSFDVKGEAPSRCRGTQATAPDAPVTPPSRGGNESSKAASPQGRPLRPNSRDQTTTGSHGLAVAPKSDQKSFPPRAASRNGPLGRGKGLAGVDEGGKSSVSPSVRKDGGKAKSERRDGIVERAISEADDMVVCVLHPGGEEDDRDARSAQPPPLLRAFNDDWEALRARGGYSDEQSEIENTPLWTDSFSISLPMNGNPTVLDRTGGCDVVLARRVGPGEVVKELHVQPVSRRNACGNENDEDSCVEHKAGLPVSRSCRFVLLTNKGATDCAVCPSSKIPTASPAFTAMAPSQSPAIPSFHSTSPSPSPSIGHEAGHVGGANRLAGRSSSSMGPDVGAAEDPQELVIFLRRSCRFNNDLVLASITSAYLFALTMEGIEVWTFPPDEVSAIGEPPQNCLEDSSRGGTWTPVMSSCTSPRPCLLHVQKLEVNGVLPRSPASCMVSLDGVKPRLLLFPSPPATQVASLAFLARQCRRRLRSQVVADEPVTDYTPDSCKPQSSNNPFAAWSKSDADPNGERNWGELKLDAWRHGFCGLAGGASRKTIASPLALLLRLRTSTQAFRLLAAAEERSPRPLSATTSATFMSAAEGLHGALAAEATAAWRAAVGTESSDDNTARAGPSGTLGNYASDLGVGVKKARIETVLAGLVNCWRLQRVTARCASLVGRLMLERAVSEVKQSSFGGGVGAGLAYSRACRWLLVSGEPLVESFARLQDVAACMLATEGEVERTVVVASSVVSLDDDEEGNSDLTTAGVPSPGLEHLLPRALYESFLLPSLGVGDNPKSQPPIEISDAPASFDSNGKSLSLDDVLAGLVSYLHGEDMRWLSQHRDLRGLWNGAGRSTPLSEAVVKASRAPWTACPLALRQALLALGEQDRRLAENTSSNISSSSGSSNASISGMKTLPRDAKRRGPRERARRDHSEGTEHPRRASLEKRDLVQDQSREPVHGSSIMPFRQWVVVARAILMGYSEHEEAYSAAADSFEHSAVPPLGGSVLAADPQILQLACERHPNLVVPAKIGAGPLARDLIAGGKTQPVVAALVNLTLCDGGSQGAGSGGASFGPNKAWELLQLTEDGFSPTIDPLQALRVFGVPGRRIAERLDSLRRVSLDLSGPYGSPTEVRLGLFDGDVHKQSSSASDGHPERSETRVLSAAARDFLSRRCSASLALADTSARHRERLSQTPGAPETWRVSFARNRALDRAALRFLIGAHLDDLRALENPTARNPQTIRSDPVTGSGWGAGLARTAHTFRTGTRRDHGESSWADAIVPLLSSQVSRTRGGRAEESEHVDAILCLVREITWRGSSADKDLSGGIGCSMSQEEAEEVVTEARRRLPTTELAPVSAGNLLEFDDSGYADHELQLHPWGSGAEGIGQRRAPWPWAPRAVPASAVGALLALAAALPPAGKLLAGLDVILQIGQEVVAAAKAEAAAAAGAVAAAAGSVVKGGMRGGHQSSKDERAKTGGTTASVEEVSRAAERALLLYVREYCGKDARKWASVTEHVRMTSDEEGQEGDGSGLVGSAEADGQKLVRALLRRCGEEVGGEALVRALPESLDLMECLDEIERSLLGE